MTDTHVRADPFFESLRLRDVHFYDTAAVLTPIFHVKAGVLEQFQLYSIGQLFERPDIDDYIEYDDDDGGYEGVIVQQDGDDGEQEPAYDESIPFQ